MTTNEDTISIDEVVAMLERDGDRIGYTIKSAARALDVPVHTILLAIRRGHIQPRRLGVHSIITRQQLIRFWENAPLPHDRRKRENKPTEKE